MPRPRLSVQQLFHVEASGGLQGTTRGCFLAVADKPGYASGSLPAKPRFLRVTSSWEAPGQKPARPLRALLVQGRLLGWAGVLTHCAPWVQQTFPVGAEWHAGCEHLGQEAGRCGFLWLDPYGGQCLGLAGIFLSFSSHPIGFPFTLKAHREGQLKQLSVVGSPLRAINHTAATEEQEAR